MVRCYTNIFPKTRNLLILSTAINSNSYRTSWWSAKATQIVPNRRGVPWSCIWLDKQSIGDGGVREQRLIN